MLRVTKASYILMGVLVAGCDPGEPAGETSASDTGAETSALECIDGEISCPCESGSLCEQGLMCVEGICQDSAVDGTASGGVDSAGASSGDGGVDQCSSNDECDVSEICVFSTCTPSEQFVWNVAVSYFEPGGCRDGWGTAEIFYRYYDDIGLVSESSTQGCPASWSDDWLVYYPLDGFRLEFWELDLVFDDQFTTVCWPTPPDDCGSLPDEVMHDGGYFGFTSDGLHYIELVAEPVLE